MARQEWKLINHFYFIRETAKYSYSFNFQLPKQIYNNEIITEKKQLVGIKGQNNKSDLLYRIRMSLTPCLVYNLWMTDLSIFIWHR